MNPTAVHLSSARDRQIPYHGEAQVENKIRQLRRTFKWNVVIANVIALLGKDFLSNYGLLVDCTNNRLIDTSTNKTIKTGRMNCFVEQICINNVPQLPDSIKNLLQEYPSLTAPRSNNYTSLNSRVIYLSLPPTRHDLTQGQKARRPIKVGIKGRGGRERAETRTLLVNAAHRLP